MAKLSFIFLLGFAAVSFQQYLPGYYSPQILYNYPSYHKSNLDDSINVRTDHPYLDVEDQSVQDDDNYLTQIQSRAANRQYWARPTPQVRPRPLRLWFDNVVTNPYLSRPFNLFNPFVSPYTPAPFRTTVTTVSTTSTVLTASVMNCIPSNLFASNSASVSCRKRREAAEMMDLLMVGHNDQQLIQPTVVQPIEITTSPAIIQDTPNGFHDVTSSKNEDRPQSRPLGIFGNREVVTHTTTSIYYVFSSTIIQKKATLASTSQLLCLPSGFVICY